MGGQEDAVFPAPERRGDEVAHVVDRDGIQPPVLRGLATS
jgi:hypothetical protein